MKSTFVPNSALGKWSVGLQLFFLAVIIASILLVKIFGVLSFDDHWWDVTVPVAFGTSITAFILGIIAIRKKNERSAVVYLSVITGLFTILFIPLHSLFISD